MTINLALIKTEEHPISGRWHPSHNQYLVTLVSCKIQPGIELGHCTSKIKKIKVKRYFVLHHGLKLGRKIRMNIYTASASVYKQESKVMIIKVSSVTWLTQVSEQFTSFQTTKDS